MSQLIPNLFQGQSALVTGGGTGLGLQISRGLARLGAHVVIASRSAEHHAALLDEAATEGWSVEAEVLDVRHMKDVAACAERLHERLAERSGGAFDLLVNNAAGNFVCPAERLSERAWRAVLGIVLDGTFYCSREFGRGMIQRGTGGSILNIVATYAWTGMPGVVHSASAKAGVLAMTKTLAAEWARHQIRVNAIAPGVFDSQGAGKNLWPDEATKERLAAAVPAGRFASTEEIAEHCLWLLSPGASYVTGECFTADGGASLGRGMWAPGERLSRK
jgi:NAD(P)-dependent dehydrogenase (short-subunit alcohol dehydrogenase family)